MRQETSLGKWPCIKSRICVEDQLLRRCSTRRLRLASGGFAYHVLNRAVARARIFDKSMDYAAFARVLRQAKAEVPMRLLSYCCMPNHWHLVLWPWADADLSRFLHWLTMTH